MERFDVAIIGCGVTGAAVAYTLARYRLRVLVLEKENDVAMGTTKANSGILHAGYDPEPGTLMAALNVEGNAMAWEICHRLDVSCRRCGSLVLAFTPEEEETLNTLYRRGLANGVKGMEIWNAQKLHSREPALSPKAVAALYAPSGGVVSPWGFTLAMAQVAVQNGAKLLLESGVESIERAKEGYVLNTPSASYAARFVVNAAGLYADVVHNMVAQPAFAITPERGEYYLLDKSVGDTVQHIIFQCPGHLGKGTLVAPTAHGNIIVGPNNEAASGPQDTATTADGLAQVARLALKSVPGLALGENIRNFSGNRAATAYPDFIIAPAKGAPGFINLAAIRSPGLTAAPAIGTMAARLLAEQGLPLKEKAEFNNARRVLRFAHLTEEEKARVARENPAYGHVVCRCETVTEGEILACMAAPIPPRSVAGVKRRCHAGMGRCQGGFCGPRVVELLAEQLGTSPLNIPQDGAGSNILLQETKNCGGQHPASQEAGDGTC